MTNKTLRTMVLVELAICIFCFFSLPNKIEQPKTFLSNLESYQLAKYSRLTYGDICYKYCQQNEIIIPGCKERTRDN